MTRIHSDAARQFAERNAVVRPEPLGVVSPRAVSKPPATAPLMRYTPPNPQYWPPLTSNADRAAILREERFRARELADLPDTCEEDLLVIDLDALAADFEDMRYPDGLRLIAELRAARRLIEAHSGLFIRDMGESDPAAVEEYGAAWKAYEALK